MIYILLIIFELYFITEYNMPEDKKLSSGTSVVRSYMEKIDNISNVENYKYRTKGLQVRRKRLKDLSYTFSENIVLPKNMYPQGICFTEKYVFITLYTTEKKELGKIMVFDKENSEFMASFGMDAKSHLGGIAYDGADIWVCNSSNMSVERISYSFICNFIKEHPGESLDIRNLVERYPVNLIPSCITFYENQLWVATHAKQTNSQMISYSFMKEENRLEFHRIYHIPSKVQGVTFEEGGKVILSTSYGRRRSSYLKIYSSVESMTNNIEKYEKMIELPPCSEGISMEQGRLYVIFESAGEKYLEGTDGKGKSISPLDKLLVIDLT